MEGTEARREETREGMVEEPVEAETVEAVRGEEGGPGAVEGEV